MRSLIYVPIIHSLADMGSMGSELREKSIARLGEKEWENHAETINGYWDAIESWFSKPGLNISGMKIYQDAMFVDDGMAMNILAEGVKSGSRNSSIVTNLISRGALLVKTEDFKISSGNNQR